MKKAEVIELFIEIKQEYGNFDDSDENIDRHVGFLKDFPYSEASKNVKQHIMTNRFPPGIADIRGRLGDLMDGQRSKEQALAHHAKLEEWAKNDSSPPEGYWESMKEKLRGESK